jgi:hypothetical protein
MKGKLLKNCGLLVEAAFKKISALASKRDFAAACTKRTIRFELHDNYRDARRYWIGVPESDLRTGALVFYCTTDSFSFLPSRVTKIGGDIEEEIKSLSNARDGGDDARRSRQRQRRAARTSHQGVFCVQGTWRETAQRMLRSRLQSL